MEIKILRRVRAEPSRRPPRHRRDACSMAWRCRFVTAPHPTHWLISTQVITDNFHRLLLAHEHADHAVLAVLQEFDLADAAFDPLLLAAAFVEQRLGKSEQLGPNLEIDVLVFFMCLHLDLVQLDHRRELRGRLLRLGVRLFLLLVACVDIKSPMAVDGAGAAASSSSLIS